MPPANTSAPIKLSLPLQYQEAIFKELRDKDELVILARGLGLLRIVTNLLHSYDAAGDNLVIVVGADERENAWLGEAVAEHYAVSRSPLARGLKVINTDKASVSMRERMYSEGGVMSITSQILVVDLLSMLLDPSTVTGLVVLHAEKVIATSLEAFIMRIYRQYNKLGFLKAFSDSPEPFISGFAPLSTTMRHLFFTRPSQCSLWPRFEETVAISLEGKRKAEVIELEVPMTDAMREIQNAILECVDVSIRELRKANSGLDMDDWTLDSALNKNFDVIIRRQLDPVWHRVSWRTKQIVNDLTVLRSILHSLLSYDCVSLMKYLDTILAAHSPPPGSTRQNQSPWLFLEAANTIFQSAKGRVYKGAVEQSLLPSNSLPDSLHPVLEEQPKWDALSEVLEEIETDIYANPDLGSDSTGVILVMCNDQRTCRQIREYLETKHIKLRTETTENSTNGKAAAKDENKASADFMLRRKLRDYLEWKRTFAKVSASLFDEIQKSINESKDASSSGTLRVKSIPHKRRRVRGGGPTGLGGRDVNGAISVDDKAAQVANLLAEIRPTEADQLQKPDVIVDDLEETEEDFFELYDMPDLVVVHPYDGDMDDHILEELRPRYIIMYELDAAFVRRVEVYRSSHTNRAARVYFMYYGGSVEEQRYLSSVRREKDSFTRLIQERGRMPITLTHDASDAANANPEDAFLRTINTRIAGGGQLSATATPPKVIVDVREFRSALPSLLHGRAMIVTPCQLTVGDYVLSPEICVERKSVRDLVQSFKSGRLFNQAETMLQYYKYPMLLIEFDHNKSFTLDPFVDFSTSSGSSSSALKLPDSDSKDLSSKLVLLTLAFPRLKIIWSSSPYQTAEIFAELKKNRSEPDPMAAVQAGLNVSDYDGNGNGFADPNDRAFNQTPQDMLRCVPGVDRKVLNRLVLETRNVMEVANMSVEMLDEMVGGEAARPMNRFFGRSVFVEEN